MKILVAGDTHGDLVHAQYLVKMAQEKKCHCVFVVGDFGYWAHVLSGVEFLDRLNQYANVTGMPVYFLDGNHDKTSHLLEHHDKPERTDAEGFLLVRQYVRYARRGHRWTWGGVRFIALGGAYSVDKDWRLDQEEAAGHRGSGQLWFPEEEMSDQELEAIFSVDASQVDVLLAHDIPRGTPVPFGDWETYPETLPNQDRMAEAIRVLDPQLYIHGHLHIRYQAELMHSHRGFFRDMHMTTVIGLDCNSFSAEMYKYGKRYEKTDSWMILDTDAMEGYGQR